MYYEFDNKSFNNQDEFVEYLIKRRDESSNSHMIRRYVNHGKIWTNDERMLLKKEIKSSDFIELCNKFGRSPKSIFAEILNHYRIDFYNEDDFFSKINSSEKKKKFQIKEKDKGNDIDIEMLIAMKIYILFRKFNESPYQDVVIKTIKGAIECKDFQSSSNERKAFYLCSLCEVFRRLEMSEELIVARRTLMNYSDTSLYNLYKDIIDEEKKLSFNLDQLFDSTFTVNDKDLPFSFNPDKISKKYKVLQKNTYDFNGVRSRYYEVSGTNNIPYLLFNLNIEVFINHSLFLLDKTLPEIIESHFSKETSENILRFLRPTK